MPTTDDKNSSNAFIIVIISTRGIHPAPVVLACSCHAAAVAAAVSLFVVVVVVPLLAGGKMA
jgi:hypothetical protein